MTVPSPLPAHRKREKVPEPEHSGSCDCSTPSHGRRPGRRCGQSRPPLILSRPDYDLFPQLKRQKQKPSAKSREKGFLSLSGVQRHGRQPRHGGNSDPPRTCPAPCSSGLAGVASSPPGLSRADVDNGYMPLRRPRSPAARRSAGTGPLRFPAVSQAPDDYSPNRPAKKNRRVGFGDNRIWQTEEQAESESDQPARPRQLDEGDY